MKVRYYLACRGCGAQFTAMTRGLALARRHDESDECNRKGDREAEGFDLDWEEVD